MELQGRVLNLMESADLRDFTDYNDTWFSRCRTGEKDSSWSCEQNWSVVRPAIKKWGRTVQKIIYCFQPWDHLTDVSLLPILGIWLSISQNISARASVGFVRKSIVKWCRRGCCVWAPKNEADMELISARTFLSKRLVGRNEVNKWMQALQN